MAAWQSTLPLTEFRAAYLTHTSRPFLSSYLHAVVIHVLILEDLATHAQVILVQEAWLHGE